MKGGRKRKVLNPVEVGFREPFHRFAELQAFSAAQEIQSCILKDLMVLVRKSWVHVRER
jgi:hypothetical protein